MMKRIIFVFLILLFCLPNGNFVISDIPPGVYTIKAWHEALGVIKMENIKIEAGKPGNIKLEYK